MYFIHNKFRFTYSVRYFVKSSVSPTMSAIGNYLLGCNFQQRCVYPLQRGVVRALKNVEITYLLDSNNKSEKTQQSCRIGAL